MELPFYKYQGTGNDFVIFDNRGGDFNDITVEQVEHLCNRRFGIGADGLMLLNQVEGYDFEMKYFNADGRESSMCGNGGRCLVQFAYDIGIKQNSYHFIAIDGPHQANFSENGWVRLKMKDVDDISIHNDNCVLNTGSPHYVKAITDLKDFNVVEEGKKIRFSDYFVTEGINVNFVKAEGNKLIVRTYERGVEDETYSCGTGVTACALVNARHDGYNRIEIETLGGNLAVEFNKTGPGQFENIWLCGPATFVYKGEITL